MFASTSSLSHSTPSSQQAVRRKNRRDGETTRRSVRTGESSWRCSCLGVLALALTVTVASDVSSPRETSPCRRVLFLESTSAPEHPFALSRRARTNLNSTAAAAALATVTVNNTSSVPLALTSSSPVTSARRPSLASSTASATGSASTVLPSGYTVPQPFDSTLGVDFASTACPSFFQTFLADPTFISCAPFSLLLTTSSGFFDAQRSPNAELPFVLDASCSANVGQCSALMNSLARQIQQANTCGADLAAQKSVVVEALQGFQNYAMQQKVGCQKDDITEQYCYAKAAAQEPASDIYFYLLPSGTSLPSGTTSSCSNCTQSLMTVYSTYASNSSLEISKTYSSARNVAALTCGPNFSPAIAASTLAATSSSASKFRSPLGLLLVTILSYTGLATLV